MQTVAQAVFDRFGVQIHELPIGHQKALYFLRILQESGNEIQRIQRTPFSCLDLPQVTIEEYYLILAHITELPHEQTTAIAMLMEKV